LEFEIRDLNGDVIETGSLPVGSQSSALLELNVGADSYGVVTLESSGEFLVDSFSVKSGDFILAL